MRGGGGGGIGFVIPALKKDREAGFPSLLSEFLPGQWQPCLKDYVDRV